MKKESKRAEVQKEPKRLYRSRKDKIIAGVCGGIAEYYNIDPVWVRLIAALLVFVKGLGLLVYLILWIVVPKNPDQSTTKDTKAEIVAAKLAKKAQDAHERRRGRAGFVIGILVIIIGLSLLSHNLWDVSMNYLWPALLIALGLIFLLRGHHDEA